MVREVDPISEDVQLGTSTPDPETTLEALIKAHNNLPRDTDLTDGQLLSWNASTGKLEGVDSAAHEPLRSYSNTGEWIFPAGSAFSNAEFSDGDLRLIPIYTEGGTADRIACDVVSAGTAGSVVRLVIYEDADGDGIADTLLLDAGTVDGTITGVNPITIAQALPRGPVWCGAINQGGATTRASLRFISGMISAQTQLRRTSQPTSLNFLNLIQRVTGITGAAPATISPSLAGTANPAITALRVG